MVNRRALRTLDADVETFKRKAEGAKTLRAAMDDGFDDFTADGEDRRPDLKDCELLIVGWQLRSRGGSGNESARVWALAKSDTGDVRKVKFYAAGGGNLIHPGIPVTLRELEDNGVTGDVRVVFRMEEYDFFDAVGDKVSAIRYWIEDVSDEDNAAREEQANDQPDF
jgi:hypothetical protein